MEKYSIVDFLESLADDEVEKILIRLISEGNQGEELLRKTLKKIVGVKNDNV
ncbi:MAG: hypothetical protein ACFFCW_19160 [Candidatus Hodarchaeota archaeon]